MKKLGVLTGLFIFLFGIVNPSFAWHLSTYNNNGNWDYSLSWTSSDIAALPALTGDCTGSNSPADFFGSTQYFDPRYVRSSA